MEDKSLKSDNLETTERESLSSNPFFYEVTNQQRNRNEMKSPERPINMIETQPQLSVKDLVANVFNKKKEPQSNIRLTHHSEKQNHLLAEMLKELRSSGGDYDVKSLIDMFQSRISQSSKSSQEELDFWNNIRNNSSLSKVQLEEAIMSRQQWYWQQDSQSQQSDFQRSTAQDQLLSGLDFGVLQSNKQVTDTNSILSIDHFKALSGTTNKKASRKLNLLELAEQELQVKNQQPLQELEEKKVDTQELEILTDQIYQEQQAAFIGNFIRSSFLEQIKESIDDNMNVCAEDLINTCHASLTFEVIDQCIDLLGFEQAIPSTLEDMVDHILYREILKISNQSILQVQALTSVQQACSNIIEEAVVTMIMEIIQENAMAYQQEEELQVCVEEIAETMLEDVLYYQLREMTTQSLIGRSIDNSISVKILNETIINLITDICKEACVQQYQVRKTVNNSLQFLYLDLVDNEIRSIMIESYKDIKEKERFGKTIFDEVFDEMLHQQITMVASSSMIAAKVKFKLEQDLRSPARSTKSGNYEQQQQPRGSVRARESCNFVIRSSSKSPMREVANRFGSTNRQELKPQSKDAPKSIVSNHTKSQSSTIVPKYDSYQQSAVSRNQQGIQPKQNTQAQRSISREKNIFAFSNSSQPSQSQTQTQQNFSLSKVNNLQQDMFDPEKMKERLKQKFSQMKKKEEDEDDDWDINEGSALKLPSNQNVMKKY